jgi:hypothetical protein
MSEKAAHYAIKITSVGVPDALSGIPLPVEIIPQEGEAKRSLITFEENHTETESVEWPGSYMVRTVLPSGQMITKTTIVPEPTEPQGEASGDVTLDFGQYIPVEESDEPISFARYRDQLQRRTLDPYLRIHPLENLPSRRTEAHVGRGISADSRVSVDYGFFIRWIPEVSNESLESSSETIVIEPVGTASAGLSGNIELEQHQGWTDDSLNCRPLLMRARYSLLPSGGEPEEALFIWPPSGQSPPLSLLPDLDPGVNSNAPSLLAYSQSGDREVDLMFSYVRGEIPDLAREYEPRMIERAQNVLQYKIENPVAATLAAYTLLKVSNTERQDWVFNLSDWFKHLPDGAIIYGWYLIRAGKAEQAHAFFRTALNRGVPMYSEGVRLLRDGLNFLSGLYPEAAKVRADAAQARRIADAANLDSELSCLRLGRGLSVLLEGKAE